MSWTMTIRGDLSKISCLSISVNKCEIIQASLSLVSWIQTFLCFLSLCFFFSLISRESSSLTDFFDFFFDEESVTDSPSFDRILFFSSLFPIVLNI